MTERSGELGIERTVDASPLLDLRSRVLRPGLPIDSARFVGDDDAATRHWVVVAEGVVVGCVSVMRAADPRGGIAMLQLRGMAVDEAHMRQGVGRLLLSRVHSEVDEPMWCNARIRAEPFYARAGWVRTSDLFEIDGVGPHYAMIRLPDAP